MIFGLRGLLEHGVTEEPPDELINLIESGVRPMLATGADYREVHRVLISYSGSMESARAMRHFTNLKLWPTARIKVVHFGKNVSAAKALLADARGYLQDYGFSVDAEVIGDSPKPGLLKHATDWNADLIVLGNSAKSLLRQRVFGETALRTIRESHLPLFLSE
jgi:nucleotide-binding universal stress UspA family protein